MRSEAMWADRPTTETKRGEIEATDRHPSPPSPEFPPFPFFLFLAPSSFGIAPPSSLFIKLTDQERAEKRNAIMLDAC